MKRTPVCLLLGVVMVASGCHTDMWRQPRLDPLAAADPAVFPDGAASRPLLQNTVARGHLREDQVFFTGVENGKWVTSNPRPVTRELLLRGQERYDIYCSPCHSRLGDGQGMISRRGLTLRRPVATYHTERLRNMPDGYLYDVITNGYGAMYSYASRVNPPDRWAIVAYIRALQFSQHAPVAAADPAALNAPETSPAASKDSHGESHGAPQKQETRFTEDGPND